MALCDDVVGEREAQAGAVVAHLDFDGSGGSLVGGHDCFGHVAGFVGLVAPLHRMLAEAVYYGIGREQGCSRRAMPSANHHTSRIRLR